MGEYLQRDLGHLAFFARLASRALSIPVLSFSLSPSLPTRSSDTLFPLSLGGSNCTGSCSLSLVGSANAFHHFYLLVALNVVVAQRL